MFPSSCRWNKDANPVRGQKQGYRVDIGDRHRYFRRVEGKQTPAPSVDADLFSQMNKAKDINLKQRTTVKMASRKSDRQRLEQGESPVAMQRENSIFPPDYFKQHQILNFASAIGK